MNFVIPRHSSASAPAAIGGAGMKTARDLVSDAVKLSKAIEDNLEKSGIGSCSAMSGSGTAPEVLVICADRYHFAVSLLACWKAGVISALPPNGQEATVHALASRPDIRLILHDTDRNPVGTPGLDLRTVIYAGGGSQAQAFEPLVIEPSRIITALYTSGSTGDHKRCPKAAAEILGEAASHVESFRIPAGEIFAATVPGHHIYGLIWSVLVPLLSGGIMDRETTLFPDAVVSHAEKIGATYLVSVPAHLRALAEVDRMPRLRRITSSSAPLAPETAQKIFDKFGLRITEIFGSSETGGIAYREEPGAPQTPLAGVKVSCGEEGRLLLDSPFLPPALPRPVPCDDRIELLPDGRFILKGRLDGVVKVGGKRVSLAEVERHLLQIPGVADAAVLAAAVDSGRGAELWAAVVAPKLTKADIREGLKQWLDPVALPRRIQFVQALPREENGKLQRAKLQAVFAAAPQDISRR